ncbi:MAG: DUF5686 and carboxypeptidase regulatory-like domain-containing protein [Ferruginibacter sp.]
MRIFLSCIFLTISFYSKAQRIYGTVFNESGDLLPYSSITVKGSTAGASANEKGKFSFSLPAGKYTLVCQRIGYTAREESINLTEDTELTFILKLQKLTMDEVVVKSGGEDPAYEIIRNAIKKRGIYLNEVTGFSCGLYGKDMVKLRHLPDRIMGIKVPKSDRNSMGLDSAGQGIIYLSESISKVHAQRPGKFKMDVISSRVSGSGGFGFSFPVFISMYNNNVNVFSGQLNPRGFVSPIADGALNFYKYKFMGSFFEDGKMINTIRVWPRRTYEPLFYGTINIIENSWRIHSFDLTLTKKSQLEMLDTLQITQLHVPVGEDLWRVKNQLLHFNFKQFGIDAVGNFVNVYSAYEINPAFDKKFFDKIIIKYDTAVSKRTRAYWDSIRPVPLENEEMKDYKVKDSIYQVNKDSMFSKRNIDSLNKQQGKLKPLQFFWGGVHRRHFTKKNTYQLDVDPMLPLMQYNFAEGAVLNLSGAYSFNIAKNKRKLSIEPNLRYGFSNTHFNAYANIVLTQNRKKDDMNLTRQTWSFSGGKRVSEFYKQSSIDPLVNSISSLLYGKNYMKTYENWFGNINFSKNYESGLRFYVNAQFEDRMPLNNSSRYTLRKKDSIHISPNYPAELVDANIDPHQAFVVSASVSFKPGQRFIQFPHSKMAIGSKYPTFTLSYAKGFDKLLGSDVNFDKWRFSISDDKNFKLAGLLKYKLGTGGFLNDKKVSLPDYQHFNGNVGLIAGEWLNSFQMAGYYANSTVAPIYAFGHLEHHFNGMITNKIPLFKRLNWNLVGGGNGLYINDKKNYAEAFVGLENILKLLRVDFVTAFRYGQKPTTGFRIGAGGILGSNIQFARKKKSIDPEF